MSQLYVFPRRETKRGGQRTDDWYDAAWAVVHKGEPTIIFIKKQLHSTTTTIILLSGRSVTSRTPLTLATGLPRWREF